MNLGEFLFGASPRLQESQRTLLTPEQTRAQNFLLQLLQGNIQNFQGLDSNFSDTEAALEGNIQTILDSGFLPDIFQSAQRIVNDQGQDIESYFNATIQEPLLRQFEEDILPRISRTYGDQFFGSERREADVRAREDLLDALATERARVGFEERNRVADRAVGALATIPGLSNVATNFQDVAGARREATTSAEDRSFRQRMELINALLDATGNRSVENIAAALPGSTGLVAEVISNLTEGGGSSAAASYFMGG